MASASLMRIDLSGDAWTGADKSDGGVALNFPRTTELPIPVPAEPSPFPSAGTPSATTTEIAPEPLEPVPSPWVEVTVRSGDSLARIFSRLGIPGGDLDKVLRAGPDAADLKRIKPDQVIKFRIEDGQLKELVHEEDVLNALHVTEVDGDIKAEKIAVTPEVRMGTATGTIDSSLFLAGQQAGLTDAMIMQIASIFGYDIDFVLDIQLGDRFSVLYEEYYKNGEKVLNGNILAAEFTNAGKAHRAVRYVNSEGVADYYSDDGMSLKKAFLRTPVNFTRISSKFNLKRVHPVLNTIRAHRGVDYAAPIGTPVKATGDGKVLFVGDKGGYGKAIVLKHGDRYSTLYAHLSRFARSLRQGQTVRQGQTIGYVGRTGLATGPHLHYEFQVDGVHRNPLTVELPKALPIPAKEMTAFKNQTRTLLVQLDDLNRTNALAQRASPAADSLADKSPADERTVTRTSTVTR